MCLAYWRWPRHPWGHLIGLVRHEGSSSILSGVFGLLQQSQRLYRLFRLRLVMTGSHGPLRPEILRLPFAEFTLSPPVASECAQG